MVTPKRPRNKLTVDQKYQIIRYSEQNPTLKQVQLIDHFYNEWISLQVNV